MRPDIDNVEQTLYTVGFLTEHVDEDGAEVEVAGVMVGYIQLHHQCHQWLQQRLKTVSEVSDCESDTTAWQTARNRCNSADVIVQSVRVQKSERRR